MPSGAIWTLAGEAGQKMAEESVEDVLKVTKPCSLDLELLCRLRGGCPRIMNVEVLPMTQENKKARASWCKHREKAG